MEQYFPFSAVLSALGTTLGKGKSGTFFIATDTNSSARFGISVGEINQCTYKRFHGSEALQAILGINTARYSFSENSQFPFRPQDSVDHKVALDVLGIVLPDTQTATADATNNGFPQISETDKPDMDTKTGNKTFAEIHKHAKVKKQVYDGHIIEIDD